MKTKTIKNKSVSYSFFQTVLVILAKDLRHLTLRCLCKLQIVVNAMSSVDDILKMPDACQRHL